LYSVDALPTLIVLSVISLDKPIDAFIVAIFLFIKR
jgi:hypothetical protein